MGQIVHPNAAVSSICGHIDKAYDNSVARGGTVTEIANKEIGPIRVTIAALDADIIEAKKSASATAAVVVVAQDKANGVIRRVHDDMWNDIGRPRTDAAFELIFPNGSVTYTSGEVATLPDRMELLARLLEKNLHPKVAPDQNKVFAEKLRVSATELSAALKEARLPAVNVDLLDRTKTVIARSAQRALMGYKRSLKNAGFTEAEIHEIIPDAPKPAPKKPGKGAVGKGTPEKGAAETKTATEKGATEKGASEKGASEKGAAEKGASEKDAAEKGAAEKGAAEKSATEPKAATGDATPALSQTG